MDVTRLLVERGADLKAKNSDGDTALDLARRRNKTEVVKVLEAAEGASSSALSPEAAAKALWDAAISGDVAAAQAALASGADVKATMVCLPRCGAVVQCVLVAAAGWWLCVSARGGSMCW